MLETYRDAQQFIDSAPTLFGAGWKHVASFDEVQESEGDEYEYETEEEEVYVTMDLGGVLDPKALQSSTQYQLVGLDTPLPFLKVGNQVFQGEVTPLVGEEIICGHIRNIESHPPMYKTPHRINFRAITLEEKVLPRGYTHGPPPGPPSASLPLPDYPMDVHDDINVSQAIPGGSRSRTNPSRSPGYEAVGTLAEATATMGLGSARELTPNAQAGPSRSSSAPPGGSGSDGLGLTAGSLDAMPIPETGFAPFLPPVPDMQKRKPRKSGGGRHRRVIMDPGEMEGLNVEEMTEHQTVSVGPLVLAHLNLPIPEDGENAILKKKDIVRALSGQSPIRRRRRLPKAAVHGTPGSSRPGEADEASSPGMQGPTGQVTMGGHVAHGGEGLTGQGEITRVIRLPGGAGAVVGATVKRGGPGSRGPRGLRGGRGRGRGRGGGVGESEEMRGGDGAVASGSGGAGAGDVLEGSTPGGSVPPGDLSRGITPAQAISGPAPTLGSAAGTDAGLGSGARFAASQSDKETS